MEQPRYPRAGTSWWNPFCYLQVALLDVEMQFQKNKVNLGLLSFSGVFASLTVVSFRAWIQFEEELQRQEAAAAQESDVEDE